MLCFCIKAGTKDSVAEIVAESFYFIRGDEAEKLAVLMRGYLQSMKANLREIIHYIDESTLEKAKNEKVQKQESPSKTSKT